MPPVPRVRSRLEALQLARLRRLVSLVARSNRFYRPALRRAGLAGRLANLEAFRARMPETRKADLVEDQRRRPPFGTNLTYPPDRYARFHQTSGTSGTPLRWLDTAASWTAMLDCWDRVFDGARVGPRDRVLFAFSFGPFLGFWTAFEGAARRGCLCLPGGGMSSSARLRSILDNRVTVLCCTPTYALRLAEVAAQERFPVGRTAVRALIVAGEPGAGLPHVRARIERRWPRARLYDHHGMTEVGPVSYQCPVAPGRLHVIEDSYLAEIVDPGTGRPAEPGKTGELVLTTLRRDGMPLLRYRTGDLVRSAASGRCRCGSVELALEGGILGRTDDMLIIRGANVYPSAVEDVVVGHREVREYQARVRRPGGLAELSILVELKPGVRDPRRVAGRIERALRNAFHLRVPVRAVRAGSLPRFELKARRWIREPEAA